MADLRAYLADASSRPFCYGAHDCCTVAAGWVQAATGRDVLRGHSYANLRDGLRQLAAHGLSGHVDIFARVLPQIATLRLVAGDIAVLDGFDLPALGIVQPGGESVWCFGPDGAGTVPLTAAKYGFRAA